MMISIYKLHDDIKDKEFELELSWVKTAEGKHQMVPKAVRDNAAKIGKAAKEAEDRDEPADVNMADSKKDSAADNKKDSKKA